MLPRIQDNQPAAATAASDITLPEMQDRPLDLKTFFLGGLLVLAVLAALYVAHDIALPIVFAFVLKLMLQPALRFLERMRMPRTPAAILILLMLFSLLFALGEILVQPASNWAEKMPSALSRFQERISPISKPIQETQKLMLHAEVMAQAPGPKVMPVAVQGTRLFDKVLASSRAFATGLFTTIMVLFFFMVSGDTFLRRLVEILPRFQDKRQAVDISQQIERDISTYLFTISVMNTMVGIATGMVTYFAGLGDPLLWGTLAFLLNYIPIVGPFIMGGTLLVAGIMVLPGDASFLPLILYYVVHAIEANFITPLLLAQRFTLNPVLVILSLIFWHWMWGFPGAILATPMLAIFKIICDRIQRLKAVGHFLEG